MANSFVRYTGDNSTTAYSIPFSYRATGDLTVTLAGSATTAFTLNAAGTTLTFSSPPASNVAIEIRRTTSQTTRLTDYASGSVLTENDLDTDSEQAFFMSQEAIDDADDVIKISNTDFQYDAGNKQIRNVANPTSNQDVATKHYLENTWLSTANKTALTTVNANIANINAVNSNSSNINSAVSNATNINTVATNIGSVNTVATDISKVIAVANDLAEAVSEVETVADDLNEATSEIDTVATNIANVNTVGNAITNVNTVATNISNINSVAGNETNINAVNTNSSNINTVAGISSDINTVRGINLAISNVSNISNDVTGVNGNIANITTVAGISSDVTSVANDATDIGTVATDIANVNTVAGISGNVTTVAGISSNVTSVANNSANINSVAGNATNINTVAGNNSNISTVAGVSGNVTTVAGISADVTAVAGDATDIGTVATNLAGTNTIGTVAGSITNVNNVGGSITNVNTVASNLASVNNFGEVYRIASSAPTTSLNSGDLYFDTTTNILNVYGASGWQNAGSSVNGTSQRYNYTATSGQTTFTGADNNGNTLAYDAGYIDVYLNGVKLLNGTDVTVTSGSSIVLTNSGATTGDVVDIVAYGTFSVASLNADNLDSGTVPDARITGAYTGITNLTMSGDLTVNGNAVIQQTTGDASLTISANENASNREPRLNLKGYNTSSNPTISFGDNAGYPAEISYENLDNSMRIRTNNGERMRIDSSGNLLVGKTSADDTIVGHIIRNDGALFSTTNGSNTAVFERLTSDGDIIRFEKDNTTVGKIGVDNSDNLFISGNSSHAGFEFGSSSIVAYKNGASPDNAISLGGGAQRFANLYLGGGLYVGGTGTANKLDEYEEGTFTPAITVASGSVTHSTQTGNYTKVGRLVYFDIRVTLSAISSPSGNLDVAGLPFTGGISGRAGLVKFTSVNNFSSITNPDVLGSYIATGTKVAVNNNAGAYYNASNLTATTQFDISGMYQTN